MREMLKIEDTDTEIDELFGILLEMLPNLLCVEYILQEQIHSSCNVLQRDQGILFQNTNFPLFEMEVQQNPNTHLFHSNSGIYIH